jgi:uncharacterized protein with FMN-binding domain
MGRVIVAIAGTVAGLVLLLSFKTTGTAARSTSASSTPPIVARATPAAKPTTPTTKKKTTTPTTKTVTGGVSENQYGPVQVQVTVRGGKVTAVTATQYPNGDSRSAQISAYAIPALNQEALQAGSAGIDMISGASYTSESYLASLQSALSKAGVA